MDRDVTNLIARVAYHIVVEPRIGGQRTARPTKFVRRMVGRVIPCAPVLNWLALT
jgi:hypothetical protein